MIEKETVEKWYEFYKQGWTLEEVGNYLGKNGNTIYHHFKRHGFMRRTNKVSERSREITRNRWLNMKPEDHPRWKGGINIHAGYVLVWYPGHPRANDKHVFEHILIIEKALGKYLLEPHCSHHINGNRSDNRNNNLVACEDNKYHSLLHQRRRSLDSCGHVNWRRCTYCKKWDDPTNLLIYLNQPARHSECQKIIDKSRAPRDKFRPAGGGEK